MLYSKDTFHNNSFLLMIVLLLFSGCIGLAALSDGNTKAQSKDARRIKIHDRAKASVVVKQVRNIEDEDWLSDLEIEVQNNSNKPIYYLLLIKDFPDLPSGKKTVIPLVYGRWELMKSGQLATSSDTPILPGRKYVFSMNKGLVEGFMFHKS